MTDARSWRQRRRDRTDRSRRYRFHECADRWLPTLRGYRALMLSTLLVAYFAVQFGVETMEQLAQGNGQPMADLTWRMIQAGLIYPVARAVTGFRAAGLGVYERFRSESPIDLSNPDPEAAPVAIGDGLAAGAEHTPGSDHVPDDLQ